MNKEILLQHAIANFIVKADAMKHMWFDHKTATLWHINELMGIQNSIKGMGAIIPADEATKEIWNALACFPLVREQYNGTDSMDYVYDALANFDPLKASFEVIEAKITKY